MNRDWTVTRPVIGLVGAMGSGKSSLGTLLAARFGWDHIEVDQLGHQALAVMAEEVVGVFGLEVRGADGTIDRRVLGARVFGDPLALARLEGIVHPWMAAEVERLVVASTAPGIIINAAILVHMGLDRFCTTIVHVRAPWLARAGRLVRRDRRSRDEVLGRMRSQGTLVPKDLPSRADILTVSNRRIKSCLRRLVDELEYRYGPEKNNPVSHSGHGGRRRIRRHRPLAAPAPH